MQKGIYLFQSGGELCRCLELSWQSLSGFSIRDAGSSPFPEMADKHRDMLPECGGLASTTATIEWADYGLN